VNTAEADSADDTEADIADADAAETNIDANAVESNSDSSSVADAENAESGTASDTDAAEPSESADTTENSVNGEEASGADQSNTAESDASTAGNISSEEKTDEKPVETVSETDEAEKSADSDATGAEEAEPEQEELVEKEDTEEEAPVYIDSAEAENEDGVHAVVRFADHAGVQEGTALSVETIEVADESGNRTDTYKRVEEAMTAYVAQENGINRDDIIVDDIYAVRLSLKNAEGEEASFEGEASVVIDYPADIELEDDRFFAVFDNDIKAVAAEIYRESGRTTVSFTTPQLGLTGYYLAEEKVPVYESELSWESEDGTLAVDVEFEEGARIPENAYIEVTVADSGETEFPLNAHSQEKTENEAESEDEADHDDNDADQEDSDNPESQSDDWSRMTDRVLSYLDEQLEKSALDSGEYAEEDELPWTELDYAKLLEIHIYDEEGNEVTPEDASRMHVKVTLDREVAPFDVSEASSEDEEIEYKEYILRENKEYHDYIEQASAEHPDEELEIPEDLYSLEEADTTFERLYDDQGENYALTAEYNIEMSGFMGILISHVEIPVVYVNELTATSDDQSLELTAMLPDGAEVEEGAVLYLEQIFGNDHADGSERTWNESAKDLIAEQLGTDPENVEISFSRLYKLHAEDKDGNELLLDDENWPDDVRISARVNREVETTENTIIRFFRTSDAVLTEDELASVSNEDGTLQVEYQPTTGEIAGLMVFTINDAELHSDEAISSADESEVTGVSGNDSEKTEPAGESEEDADTDVAGRTGQEPNSVSGNSAEDTTDKDDTEQADVSGNESISGNSATEGSGSIEADVAVQEMTETAAGTENSNVSESSEVTEQAEADSQKNVEYMQGTLTDGSVTLTFDASAQIPQGTILTATPEYDMQYIEKLQRLLENEETKLLYARVYTISLENNGEAVAPAGALTVSIRTRDTVADETGRTVVKYVDGIVERIAARDASANPGFFESLTGTNGLTFTFDTFTGSSLTIGTAVTGELTDENKDTPIDLAVAPEGVNTSISGNDVTGETAASETNYAHELTATADGVTVTATMGDEAGIPEGSILSVRLIEEGSNEYKNLVRQYNQANPDRQIDTEPTVTESIGDFFSGLIGNEKEQPVRKTQAKFVDITIIDPEGNTIEPSNKVKVEILFDNGVEASGIDNVSVVHFEDQKTVKSLTAKEHAVELSVSDARKSDGYADNDTKVKADDTSEATDDTLMVTEDTAESTDTVKTADDISTSNRISVDGVSFETDGFSVYGVVFSTDVSLINFVGDGANVQFFDGSFTLEGGNSISLKSLLTELGITNDEEAEDFVSSNIKNVTFTNADAVEIRKIEETVSDGLLGIGKDIRTVDWTITPLKLFETTEYLMLERLDGEKACIKVEATGIEEAKDKFVTISAADGRILPSEATATAEILDSDEAAQAKAAVEAYAQDNRDEGLLTSIREFASFVASDNVKAEGKKEYKVFDIDLQNVVAENYADGFSVNVKLFSKVAGTDFALYHIHDGEVEEIAVDVIGDHTENGSTVASEFVFETNNFSKFVLSYTVDFEYETDDIRYTYSLVGGKSIRLDELLVKLGICVDETEAIQFAADKVENAVFSNTEYVEVVKEGSIWILHSLKAFDTNESLTIVLSNGDEIVIRVTDAQTSGIAAHLQDATISGGSAVESDGTWYAMNSSDSYNIRLFFKESANRQFASLTNAQDDSLVLEYSLPKGIEVQTQSGSTDFYNSTLDITVAIPWSVSSDDGKITFTLDNTNKKYQKTNSDGTTSTYTAYEVFDDVTTGEILLDFACKWDGETNNLVFSNAVNKNVTTDPAPEGTLELTKNGWFDEVSGQIKYVVTAKAKDGFISAADITDTLTGAGLSINSGVTVTSNDYNNNHGSSYQIVSASGNNLKVALSNMPSGHEYYINYAVDVDYQTLDTDSDGKVTINADNNISDGKTSVSANVQRENYVYTNFSKTAGTPSDIIKDGDRVYREIEWTISMNNSMIADLSSSTVKDIITSTTPPMAYSGDGIIITRKTSAGEETLPPVKWEDLTSYNSTSGWTYTFPENAGKAAYTITYKTRVDVTDLEDSASVTNKAEGQFGSSDGNASVNPEHMYGVSKEVDKERSTDTQTVWKITLDVPESGLSKAEVYETVPSTYSNTLQKNLYDEFVSYEVDSGALIGNEECRLTEWENKSGFTLKFYKSYTDENDNTPGLNAAEGARQIIVYVTTTVNSDWKADPSLSPLHVNKVKFNNIEVSADRSIISTKDLTKSVEKLAYPDSFTLDGIVYVPFKYTIKLTGVDGAVELPDSMNTDGVIYWNKTTLPGNEADTWSWADNMKVICGTNDWDSIESGRAAVSQTENTSAAIFTVSDDNLKKSNSGDYYAWYKITYYVLVPQEELQERAAGESDLSWTMTNTASWNGTSRSADYEVPYDGISKTLINEGELSGSNRIAKYEIRINPAGATVNDGQPYKLEDTFSNSLAIDYSSIKVDGEDAKNSTKIVSYSISGNTVTYWIRDKVPLTITYNAKVLGNGNVTISNIAKTDWGKDETKHSRQFSGNASGGGASVDLTLMKVDGDNAQIRLSGVKFILHSYSEEQEAILSEKSEAERTYTTDSNGTVKIVSQNGYKVHFNIPYYLVEDPASVPDGYSAISYNPGFTISEDGTTNWDTYTFYNGYVMQVKNYLEKGNLRIVKAVQSEVKEDKTEEEYSFLVTLYKDPQKETVASDVSGQYGDAVFVEGTATVSITGEGQLDIKGIPAGLTYMVQEETPDGMFVTYDGEVKEYADGLITVNTTSTVEVNNIREEDTVDITAGKVWDDNGIGRTDHPDIVFELYRGISTDQTEAQKVDEKILTGSETEVVWSHMPLFNDQNVRFNYWVKEQQIPEGYTSEDGMKSVTISPSENGITYIGNIEPITNTLVTTTTIKATKIWGDCENWPEDAEIKLQLLADGSVITDSERIINTSSDKIVEWENLPIYVTTEGAENNGAKIAYTVEETYVKVGDSKYSTPEDIKNEYHVSSTLNDQGIIEIHNDYQHTSINVTKTWGAEGTDSWPANVASVTVELLANGSAVENGTHGLTSDNSSYTFENLDTFDESGNKIEYSVNEKSIDYNSEEGATNYVSAISGNASDGFTINNQLSTTDLSLRKVWKNEKGEVVDDGPASGESVVIHLRRYVLNGQEKVYDENYKEAYNIRRDEGWKHTIKGLAATDPDGEKYYYVIDSEDLINGYTASFSSDGVALEGAANTLTVTNMKNDDREERWYLNLNLQKLWLDENGYMLSGDSIPDGAEATFKLCRYVVTERYTVDRSLPMTSVKLEMGENTVSYNFPVGSKIKIAATFKPNHAQMGVNFTTSNGENIRITGENSYRSLICTSDEITVTENMVIHCEDTYNLTNESGAGLQYASMEFTDLTQDTEFNNENHEVTLTASDLDDYGLFYVHDWNNLVAKETYYRGNEVITYAYGYYVVESSSTDAEGRNYYIWYMGNSSNGSAQLPVFADVDDNYLPGVENAQDKSAMVANTPETKLAVEKRWYRLIEQNMPSVLMQLEYKAKGTNNAWTVADGEFLYDNGCSTVTANGQVIPWDSLDQYTMSGGMNDGRTYTGIILSEERGWKVTFLSLPEGYDYRITEIGYIDDGVLKELPTGNYGFDPKHYWYSTDGSHPDESHVNNLVSAITTNQNTTNGNNYGTMFLYNVPTRIGYQPELFKKWYGFDAAGGMQTLGSYDGGTSENPKGTGYKIQVLQKANWVYDGAGHAAGENARDWENYLDELTLYRMSYEGNSDAGMEDVWQTSDWLTTLSERNFSAYGYELNEINGKYELVKYDYKVKETGIVSGADGRTWTKDSLGESNGGHRYNLENYETGPLMIKKKWEVADNNKAEKVYFTVTSTSSRMPDVAKHIYDDFQSCKNENQIVDLENYWGIKRDQVVYLRELNKYCFVMDAREGVKVDDDNWQLTIQSLDILDTYHEEGETASYGEVTYAVAEAAIYIINDEGHGELIGITDSDFPYTAYYYSNVRGEEKEQLRGSASPGGGSANNISADGLQIDSARMDYTTYVKTVNTDVPVTSMHVRKNWLDGEGNEYDPGDVQVVLEIQQRYRYEKTIVENGESVTYVLKKDADAAEEMWKAKQSAWTPDDNWIRLTGDSDPGQWLVEWQAAEQVSPHTAVLPQNNSWNYTWNDMPIWKRMGVDKDNEAIYSTVYYRVIETSSPDWSDARIKVEGDAYIDDQEYVGQSSSLLDQETRETTPLAEIIDNTPASFDLKIYKKWNDVYKSGQDTTETSTAEIDDATYTWPEGYTVNYALVRHIWKQIVTQTSSGVVYTRGDKIQDQYLNETGNWVNVPESDNSYKSGTISSLQDLPVNVTGLEKGGTYNNQTVSYTYEVKETGGSVPEGSSFVFPELTVDASYEKMEADQTGAITVTPIDNPVATLENRLTDLEVEKKWYIKNETTGAVTEIDPEKLESDYAVQLRLYKSATPSTENVYYATFNTTWILPPDNTETHDQPENGAVAVLLRSSDHTKDGDHIIYLTGESQIIPLKKGAEYTVEYPESYYGSQVDTVSGNRDSISEANNSVDVTVTIQDNSPKIKIIVKGEKLTENHFGIRVIKVGVTVDGQNVNGGTERDVSSYIGQENVLPGVYTIPISADEIGKKIGIYWNNLLNNTNVYGDGQKYNNEYVVTAIDGVVTVTFEYPGQSTNSVSGRRLQNAVTVNSQNSYNADKYLKSVKSRALTLPAEGESPEDYMSGKGYTFVNDISMLPEDAELVDEFALDSSDNWKKFYNDLVATDANGEPIYYYIVEVAADVPDSANASSVTVDYSYETEKDPDDPDSTIATKKVTVSNTVLKQEEFGSLRISKTLVGVASGIDKTFKVTILYSANGNYLAGVDATTGMAIYSEEPVEHTVSSSSPLTFNGVKLGTYIVTEITDETSTAIDGYSFDIQDSTTTVSTVVMPDITSEAGLVNVYTTDAQFSKEWIDGVTVDWPEGESITVEVLRKQGENEDTDFKLVYVITNGKAELDETNSLTDGLTVPLSIDSVISEDGRYSFTIDNLPKYNADGTIAYEYWSVETSTPEGWLNTSAEQNVFANRRYITRTGEKIWRRIDGEIDREPEGHVAVLRLSRYLTDGVTQDSGFNALVGVVDGTVDSSSSTDALINGELSPWKYTWGNLDEKYRDANGNLLTYVYKVDEVAVYEAEDYAAHLDDLSQARNLQENYIVTADGLSVTNQYNRRDFSFQKSWEYSISGEVIPWPKDEDDKDIPITVTLYRAKPIGTSSQPNMEQGQIVDGFNKLELTSDMFDEHGKLNPGIEGIPHNISLRATDKYFKFTITELEKTDEEDGIDWIYYLIEDPISEAFTTIHGDHTYSTRILNEETLHNQLNQYELPETGGPGTNFLRSLALACLTVAAIYLFRYRKEWMELVMERIGSAQ